MATAATSTQRSAKQTRSILCARLDARREEIEQAVLDRVSAIVDRDEVADPAIAEGLRRAVPAALDYALAVIESGDECAPPIPVTLLGRARVAARNSTSLDTVLRRYFAGYSLLGYFLVEEASRDDLMGGAELQRLVAAQGSIFDRLLAAIGEEHRREMEARRVPSGRRHAERIERLLAGELVDTSEIAYDFKGWHLGAIAWGSSAEKTIRSLASDRDLRPLLLSRDEGQTVWAWLGAPETGEPLSAATSRLMRSGQPVRLALGEPASGLSGWRLSHRQAAAALSVARRTSRNLVRYADVALVAAGLSDEVLADSLHYLYVEPLEQERDGGVALKRTLHAYLGASGNLSSAAAAIDVSPRTIRNRLRRVEELIGRPLQRAQADIQIALWLDEVRMLQVTSRIVPPGRS